MSDAIRPDEAENKWLEKFDISNIVREINENISSEDGNTFIAIIPGEYPIGVQNKVLKEFVAVGWFDVSMIGSSEKGERGGLTRVTLVRKY